MHAVKAARTSDTDGALPIGTHDPNLALLIEHLRCSCFSFASMSARGGPGLVASEFRDAEIDELEKSLAALDLARMSALEEAKVCTCACVPVCVCVCH